MKLIPFTRADARRNPSGSRLAETTHVVADVETRRRDYVQAARANGRN